MTAHDWRFYEDCPAGPLGSYNTWECCVCGAGASVGLLLEDDLDHPPGPGEAWLGGCRLHLSDDCDVAKLQVEAFQLGNHYPHMRDDVRPYHWTKHQHLMKTPETK